MSDFDGAAESPEIRLESVERARLEALEVLRLELVE